MEGKGVDASDAGTGISTPPLGLGRMLCIPVPDDVPQLEIVRSGDFGLRWADLNASASDGGLHPWASIDAAAHKSHVVIDVFAEAGVGHE